MAGATRNPLHDDHADAEGREREAVPPCVPAEAFGAEEGPDRGVGLEGEGVEEHDRQHPPETRQIADGAERGEGVGAGEAEGTALVGAEALGQNPEAEDRVQRGDGRRRPEGTRVPHSAAIPPTRGPATKPAPKAAPISPKFFARAPGAEMSAT